MSLKKNCKKICEGEKKHSLEIYQFTSAEGKITASILRTLSCTGDHILHPHSVARPHPLTFLQLSTLRVSPNYYKCFSSR